MILIFNNKIHMKYDDNGDDGNDRNDSENHDYENKQIDSSIPTSLEEYIVYNNFYLLFIPFEI